MTPNPYAPPAVTGLMDASPAGYKDLGYIYVFDATILAANPRWFNQWVPVHTDADFVLRAMGWVDLFLGAAAANFNYRIRDSQGYELSSGMISCGNLSNEPSSPTPIVPELIFPAGSSIGLDLENIAAWNIQFQMKFCGVRRYRIRS